MFREVFFHNIVFRYCKAFFDIFMHGSTEIIEWRQLDFKLAYDVRKLIERFMRITEINQMEILYLQDVTYLDLILALSEEQYTPKNELQNS